MKKSNFIILILALFLSPLRSQAKTPTPVPTNTPTVVSELRITKITSVSFDKINPVKSETNKKNYNRLDIDGSGIASVLWSNGRTERIRLSYIGLNFYSEHTVGSQFVPQLMNAPLLRSGVSAGISYFTSDWFQGCHYITRLINSNYAMLPMGVGVNMYHLNYYKYDKENGILTASLIKRISGTEDPKHPVFDGDGLYCTATGVNPLITPTNTVTPTPIYNRPGGERANIE